jgi:hypothetical protein
MELMATAGAFQPKGCALFLLSLLYFKLRHYLLFMTLGSHP